MGGLLRKLAERLGFRDRKPKADLNALPLRTINAECSMGAGAIRKVARKMGRDVADADVTDALVRILTRRAAWQVAKHLLANPGDYLTVSDLQKDKDYVRVKICLKVVKRYGKS